MMRHQRIYIRDDVAYALPDPGAFTSDEVRCAILWRNEATITGVCPVCSARAQNLNRAQRRRLARKHGRQVTPRTFLHEPDCPAGDDRLAELLAESGEVISS